MVSDMAMLLELAICHGLITIDAACAVSGRKPNAVTKWLAKEVETGRLVKAPYIHPRCFWHPHRPPGVQKLILASSVLYRCVLAESRLWEPSGREGPATIIRCGDEKEALIVDYGATPRFAARKLARWCEGHDHSDVAALGVVVPTKAKAESINRAATDLPLPIRFTISEDLWSLTCAKGRR